MKAKVKTRVSIDAPLAEVFKYLSHTKYHPLWNPHLQRITPIMTLEEGKTYETYSVVLGVPTKAVNQVAVCVTNKELEITNQTGMVQYCVSYKLQEQGSGTLLGCKIVVSADSKAFAFARPLMEHLARRELRIDLKALKRAVEQKLS